MDNASKALIMAGGVLIAIMIIGVSMYILTSARDFASSANTQATLYAVQTFNKFYLSFSNKITGLDVLNINNKVKDDSNNGYPISITISATPEKGGNLIKALEAYTGAEYMNKIYTYTIDSYDSNGYVTHITISK